MYPYCLFHICLMTLYTKQTKIVHYSDVIMSTMASQITRLTIVYSGADQRKHQSSASQAFVRGTHRWRVNYHHKGPVTRKMFPVDDVIMYSDYHRHNSTFVYLTVAMLTASRMSWRVRLAMVVGLKLQSSRILFDQHTGPSLQIYKIRWDKLIHK